MELIGDPGDFLGLNIYTGSFVRAGRGGKPEVVGLPPDYPRTSCPWLALMPQSIYWGTKLAHEVYGAKAIYITENGCGYDNEPLIRGEVHDLHRRDYVRNYLRELHRAIADRVPVKGYFLWSLLDNYEWQDGYTRRFGIVHTDFQTQKRTPKLSAHWYSAVMRENRIV
jgi:beta-glucosidase